MSKKVTVRDLRELLEKRPEKVGMVLSKSGVVVEKYVTSNVDKWFEEFTEAFNQFEKQLYKSKKVLKKLIAETLASFKARDEFVPVSKILEECINVCYRKEILGETETEVERK